MGVGVSVLGATAALWGMLLGGWAEPAAPVLARRGFRAKAWKSGWMGPARAFGAPDEHRRMNSSAVGPSAGASADADLMGMYVPCARRPAHTTQPGHTWSGTVHPAPNPAAEKAER